MVHIIDVGDFPLKSLDLLSASEMFHVNFQFDAIYREILWKRGHDLVCLQPHIPLIMDQ